MGQALGIAAAFTAVRPAGFRVDIELAIAPGSTLALLGPNGSGKSTVVAALAGLLPIESGRIELEGIVLDDPQKRTFVEPARRRVGVVFQDYLLFPRMSVLENVAFGLRSQGVPHNQARERAGEWLERLGLAGLELRKPAHLSGGQAQRVALARALVTEPELLLLDEPLSALDVTTREQLRRDLAEHLSAFPGPRLVITHDPIEAFLLSDQISIIEGGKVTQTGSAEEIRLRPRTRYAADLAGSNFFVGHAQNGRVQIGGEVLLLAEHDIDGEVLLSIRPASIGVFHHRPEGSPRNSWLTKIELVERLGDRTRLLTGSPLPLTIEITSESAQTMSLDRGREVWVAIKSTEIEVQGGSRPAL